MKSTTLKLASLLLVGAGYFYLSQGQIYASGSGKIEKKGIFPPSKSAQSDELKDPKYWHEQRTLYKGLMDHSWATEQWTKDDSRYAAIRSQLDSAASDPVALQSLVKQYARSVKDKPNDSLARFSWAYATRLLAYSGVLSMGEAQKSLKAAHNAIAIAPSPKTYNYDRLRYLLWIRCEGGGASHFLLDLSHRLLKKDPKDFLINLNLVAIYQYSGLAAERKEGYSFLEKLIKEHPDKPEVYDAQGSWYFTQYMFYHKPKDYKDALASYQKALGMYPETSPRKAQLPLVMKELQRRHQQISSA